jgi:hypothetical protein
MSDFHWGSLLTRFQRITGHTHVPREGLLVVSEWRSIIHLFRKKDSRCWAYPAPSSRPIPILTIPQHCRCPRNTRCTPATSQTKCTDGQSNSLISPRPRESTPTSLNLHINPNSNSPTNNSTLTPSKKRTSTSISTYISLKSARLPG